MKGGERASEKETADEETVRLAKEKNGKRKGKQSKSRGGGEAKNWKGWRKYFKGHLPLLSLREKLWL